jgi:hypothetical protein
MKITVKSPNIALTKPSLETPKVQGSSDPVLKDFRQVLMDFQSSWRGSQIRKKEIFENVPESYRSFIEGQIIISKLALRSQVITKTAESAGATLRRVQNFGS